MAKVISEEEFRYKIEQYHSYLREPKWRSGTVVTGPGRSGAVAATYVSHFAGIPFTPYGVELPSSIDHVIVVDTATNSGRTLRKAVREYNQNHSVTPIAFYDERSFGRLKFWYEIWEEQHGGTEPS